MRESREHSAGLTPGRAARERFYPQLVYQHMSESRPRSCTERDSAGRARKFVEGESCSGGEGDAASGPPRRFHAAEVIIARLADGVTDGKGGKAKAARERRLLLVLFGADARNRTEDPIITS